MTCSTLGRSALLAASVLLLLLCVSARAGEAADALFKAHRVLPVTVTAPMATLVRKRPKDEELPGTFSFVDVDGERRELDLKIRTRGHFRHDNCDFPPLWLNFRKSQLDGTLFEGQNKLKLVVHCDDSTGYEQDVLREYLAYRILNEVSDLSFRVRLLHVTYVDSDQRRDDQVRYAFVIEHKNRLAARLGMQDLEIGNTKVSRIHPDRLNLTSLFEYMIGNTDFSPIAGPPGDECCHNYVLLGDESPLITAIPYDFDQSGLVDAPYATPNPRFKIRTVKNRLYRGRCVNNEHLPASIAAFRANRDAIFALIDAASGMTDDTRKSVQRYITSFYEIIDDPRKVRSRIEKRCI